ncbi:MAG: uracil-DNA glycosylase family protein [Armatimonadota bacterium]
MSKLYSFSKAVRLDSLTEAVQFCTLCPRLCARNKVLSTSNGNYNSKVLFIAEAPGRLGADRTQIPLSGDKTGENFEVLLKAISWKREDVFITNALLCNPRDESGNNSSPTVEEISNCAPYLDMTINLVNPDVVVALGLTAISALARLSPNSVILGKDVSKPVVWKDKVLIPLYHPGPRAMVHRSFTDQIIDFENLSKIVNPITGLSDKFRGSVPRSPQLSPRNQCLSEAVSVIVHYLITVSQFKLTKLLYLMDLRSLEHLGHTITGATYLRQKEGPWIPDLWNTIELLEGHELAVKPGKSPIVVRGYLPHKEPSFSEAEINLILDVLERYGSYDNAKIKTAAYHTAPMRYVLRQEKAGLNMMQKAVIYKNMRIDKSD